MKGPRKKINPLRQEPKDVIAKIAANLKRKRIELGYTSSDEFYHEIPMNRSQYGKYENKKGEDMKISTLLRIVNAMGLTLEEFFKEDFK